MRIKILILYIVLLLILLGSLPGCQNNAFPADLTPNSTNTWGIYRFATDKKIVKLIYVTPDEIYSSALRLNPAGDKLAFAQKFGSGSDNATEICTINVDGTGFKRLTQNNWLDVYPAWSPDGSQIAFLSLRNKDLDIYIMDAEGSNVRKLYDSGTHDADIDWAGDNIAFSSLSSIWKLNVKSGLATRLTYPLDAGKWGIANLPAGDYDPRFSPDGEKIVFERLEDITKPHGGYDFFCINSDRTGEIRLTSTGYAQGLASWAHSGRSIVYNVAAIGEQGKYAIYTMSADGKNIRDVTPFPHPASFLFHSPIYSPDDKSIYFIGQWWQQ